MAARTNSQLLVYKVDEIGKAVGRIEVRMDKTDEQIEQLKITLASRGQNPPLDIVKIISLALAAVSTTVAGAFALVQSNIVK